MAFYNNVIAGAAGQSSGGADAAYKIERSLRFDSGSSSHLTRTPSSAGNRRTWTWSGWIKTTTSSTFRALIEGYGGTPAASNRTSFQLNNAGKLHILFDNGNSGQLATEAVFRDPSSWFHVVLAVDTTQSTASNRVKIYVNGRLLESGDYSTASYPSQYYETGINNNQPHYINRVVDPLYADWYAADIQLVDGQQLAATDFGGPDNTTGVWNPIEFTGSYNTALVKHQGDWVNDTSGTGYSSSLGADKSFDGDDTTGSAPQAGTSFLFTPSTAITGITKVRLRATRDPQQSDDHDFKLNGTNIGGSWTAGGGVAEVEFTVNNLTSIQWSTKSNGHWYKLHKVEIYYDNAYHTLITGVAGVNGFHLDFSDNSSNAALGTDSSGNNHTWTVNNLSVASGTGNDSLLDSPTNYQASSGNNGGNYATLNPLHNGQTLSNGNLDVVGTSSWQRSVSTIAMSSGKWYWEYEITASNEHIIGVGPLDMQMGGNLGAGSPPGSGYGTELGSVNGTGANSSWTNTGGSSTGDVIGVAFDADAGNMYIYKNGTALNSGTASHTGLTNGPYYAVFSLNGSSRSGTVNFGQRPFKYTNAGTNRPAATYLSLCTQNLADPLIADSSDYFDVALYTGNGTTGQSITGLEFSPDFVWIKERNSTGGHCMLDTVRGANKPVMINANSEYSKTEFFESFDSSGFTVDYNGVDSSLVVNRSAKTYVAWTWDGATVANPVGAIWKGSATKYIGVKFSSASGGTISFGQTTGTTTVEVWSSSDNSNWTQQGGTLTLADGHTLTFTDQYVYIRNTSNATFTDWFAAATDNADGHYSNATYPSGASWSGPTYTDYDWRDNGGVINEDGNIPSIVRANTSAGFSIVSYTGNGSLNATVGHGLNAAPTFRMTKRRDGTDNWVVNTTAIDGGHDYAALNLTDAFSSDSVNLPSSTVFSVGSATSVNGNGNTYVCYCFAPVEGFSAFGSYSGDGNTDGPFIYTGFRPKFILLKSSSQVTNWYFYDTARDVANVTETNLLHLSNAEGTTSNKFDILSNGFKSRSAGTSSNVSGQTYIYAVFAENPLKYARAR